MYNAERKLNTTVVKISGNTIGKFMNRHFVLVNLQLTRSEH